MEPLAPPDSAPLVAPDAPGARSAAELTAPLTALASRAANYAAHASGPGTQAAYASAWRAYSAWCAKVDRVPLCGDPALLALYLTHRADDGLSVASLGVARAAIRSAHRLAGIPLDMGDARLSLVMEGITRSKGIRPRRQAAAAVPDILRRLLAALPGPATPAAAASALAARHRAMLLLGFGAALRRSEIVALTIGDVTLVEGRGLSVLIRRSKIDQQGRGRTVAICANHKEGDFCAVTAFERWMTFRRPAGGEVPGGVIEPDGQSELPLFCGITGSGRLTGAPMSDKIVARLVKQACALAGLDPRQFSGHSLRRGLLTAAGDLQLPLVDLMRQSRHASVTTALSYIEAGDLWRNNITEPVFGQAERKQGQGERG